MMKEEYYAARNAIRRVAVEQPDANDEALVSAVMPRTQEGRALLLRQLLLELVGDIRRELTQAIEQQASLAVYTTQRESTFERKAAAHAAGYRTIKEWEAANKAEAARMKQEQYERASERLEVFYAACKLMITPDLLKAAFKLEDGTVVFWGQATVDQHARRAKMLEAHALGTLESAGRHHKAIEMIQASGVSCLNEMDQAALVAA